VGLFAAGLQPYVLGRPDLAHILPVSAMALSFLPLLAVLAARRLFPASSRWAPIAPLAAATALVLLLAPGTIGGHAKAHLGALVGLAEPPHAVEVRRGDRWFPLSDPADAGAVAALLEDVERSSEAGDRLIVAPRDLRRTAYNDTFLYYLLPELQPGTYFMEMAPGTANRSGSGFVEELRAADLLVLNRRWDAWDEPNSSRDLGPSAPNEVVERRFCRIGGRGPYELFRRCPAASAAR
jgi:hypothetical protein